MNPIPIYASQLQANQQFAAQLSTLQTNTNTAPTQTQYVGQVQGENQQFGNSNVANQFQTIMPESKGSHIFTEVDALKKMISQVT